MDSPPKPPRTRRVKAAAVASEPEYLSKVQFNRSAADDADLNALVGPLKNRTTVALILFLHGLNNQDAAFAAYAAPHQEARRKRLAASEKASTTK